MNVVIKSLVYLAFVADGFAHSQSPPPTHPVHELAAYDVVSVRPIENSSGGLSWQALGGGGFRSLGQTINGVIMNAFGVLDVQIINSPDWAKSEQYEIVAKVTEPTIGAPRLSGSALRDADRNVYRERLQSLLIDRFKLKVHTETKLQNVYVLITGKAGAKLERSTSIGSSSTGGRGLLEMSGASMPDLAVQLTNLTGHLVVDKTEMPGRFDVNLKWSPDEDLESGLSGVSLSTAVWEQLGLKLEVQKASVTVLVIDHIERPAPN